MTHHQRKDEKLGNLSGRAFQRATKEFFKKEFPHLTYKYSTHIGASATTREHAFDLGNEHHRVLIECKAHKWTESGRASQAKMAAWDQAMYHLSMAPVDYRKILFVLKDYSKKRKETLAHYYLRTRPHMIPPGVEIWEYTASTKKANKIH